MQLFDYCRSSAAYRVRIALNLKGLSYEQTSVNLLTKQQQTEQYKSVNPQGLVPALIDNGHTISQSLAICEYLEEQYPQTPLLPGDALNKALIRQLALLVACDIHPLNNLRVLNYLQGTFSVTDEQKLQWYHHWLKEGFDGYEQLLNSQGSRGQFSVGDTPTLADVCLIPQLFNARRFEFDLSSYPAITAVEQACLAHPAFASAHPAKQPDA